VVSRGMEDGTFRTQQPWLAVAAIAGMGIRVAEWYSPDSRFNSNDVEQTYTEFALKILT
ncbi:MAG: TetR/AcrR family transcriptional regulator, partial [Candidatus Dormibacteria bacterium]